MRIRLILIYFLFSPLQNQFVFGHFERRLGKLESQTWENHLALGTNQFPFIASSGIPDFSSVGALVSDDGILGTATLIAPNIAITAAHVLKNRTKDPLPNPNEWHFILHNDFESAPSNVRYSINKFIIHPDWISRQQESPPLGDGDKFGADLAIVELTNSTTVAEPVLLPNGHSLIVGQKIYVAGYGNLVDGESGTQNLGNSRRMAGENIVDRVVQEIVMSSNTVSESGGLLAFDFDSPSGNSNRLGSEFEGFENLPIGKSDSFPIELEASTAEGDSGGPMLARVNDKWRVFGIVSYGSTDSTYGDITVLTRLNNHLNWIRTYLPAWPSARMVNHSGWLESDWFGFVRRYSSGWNFHAELGWFWSAPKADDSVWIYLNHLKWLWTSRDAFPYLYSYTDGDWLYFKKDENTEDKWQVYHFLNSHWSNYLN